MKIVHLTSVHPRFDTRVFHRMCCSLAAAGNAVTLVVADGEGDDHTQGVEIVDVGASSGRFRRIAVTTRRVYDKALTLDGDVYHLHDPELIPMGLRLKRQGKTVVFDSHEDVPKQVMAKAYINSHLKTPLSRSVAWFEKTACKRFDGIIAATPPIAEKFSRINPNTVDINNFPRPDELRSNDSSTQGEPEDRVDVCYVGGISRARGIAEMTRAIGLVKGTSRLNLCGTFGAPDLESSVSSLAGWERVNFFGHVDRDRLSSILAKSVAGMVTLLETPNHVNSQPNKMFEYMSAGLPLIASDFPLWREIVESGDCGILVDPTKPEEIAEAIDFLAANPETAHEMGQRGRKLVEERYNWVVEEAKLLRFYQNLLAEKSSG